MPDNHKGKWSRVPETALPRSYPGQANVSPIKPIQRTVYMRIINLSRGGETTRISDLRR